MELGRSKVKNRQGLVSAYGFLLYKWLLTYCPFITSPPCMHIEKFLPILIPIRSPTVLE